MEELMNQGVSNRTQSGAPNATGYASAVASSGHANSNRTDLNDSLRRPAAFLAVLICALLSAVGGLMNFDASTAEAGDYIVSAANAANCVNHSWAHSSSGPMAAFDQCPSDGHHLSGMWNTINGDDLARNYGGSAPIWSFASSRFDAPTGTSIRHASVRFNGFAYANSQWVAGFQSDDQYWLDACGAYWSGGQRDCANWGAQWNAESPDQTREFDIPGGARSIRSVVLCSWSGCGNGAIGDNHWPYNQAYINLQSASVTVHEDATPRINLTGGALNAGGWMRGTQYIVFDASDYTGVQRSQLKVDGNIVQDTGGGAGCDYSRPLPCKNYGGASWGIDTRTLSDGVHSFEVTAQNAAGNWSVSGSKGFKVDNHAPAAPMSPASPQAQRWQQANNFSVSWTNPSDVDHITSANYQVYDGSGAIVAQGSQAGQDIASLTGLSVPAPGDYTVRVYLQDETGNADSSALSIPVHLKFDNVPPPTANTRVNNGWLNAQQAKAYQQKIDKPNSLIPVSGIAGYVVTTDGSTPSGLSSAINAVASPAPEYAGSYQIDNMAEGTTTVKVLTISGSGVPSGEVRTTQLKVDLTPPTLALTGAPDPHGWSRSPVALGINATDA
ncbi:MAG: hypothetical protein NVSMB25_14800 [Thermoleophilaceae bacterium]